MTGYGFASAEDDQRQITVEIKCLNSRYLDLNLRLPRAFSDREMDLRVLLGDRLERGKIVVQVDYLRKSGADLRQTCNEELFIRYYTEYKRLADRVMAPYDSLFQLALSAPEVMQTGLNAMATDEEYTLLKNTTEQALSQCEQFRTAEGKALEEEFTALIQSIRKGLQRTLDLDRIRLEKIREKLKNQVMALMGEEGFDRNRLEQEIIYYAEKLDIREECLRLETHLDYFIKTMKENDSAGKKLSFLVQEIGREINTLGAKANDVSIQQIVVAMKEDLEKIKEQLANVL
ncbi:MAG: hypothetical protein KatS3mg032_2545 [Cyclobacteriaceae bacterium]|nr:MAG: hypothetical protein KatS3mg032_2545 [Cyclobacteriaceae bacterium]